MRAVLDLLALQLRMLGPLAHTRPHLQAQRLPLQVEVAKRLLKARFDLTNPVLVPTLQLDVDLVPRLAALERRVLIPFSVNVELRLLAHRLSRCTFPSPLPADHRPDIDASRWIPVDAHASGPHPRQLAHRYPGLAVHDRARAPRLAVELHWHRSQPAVARLGLLGPRSHRSRGRRQRQRHQRDQSDRRQPLHPRSLLPGAVPTETGGSLRSALGVARNRQRGCRGPWRAIPGCLRLPAKALCYTVYAF